MGSLIRPSHGKERPSYFEYGPKSWDNEAGHKAYSNTGANCSFLQDMQQTL
jgi:hypothetical protein